MQEKNKSDKSAWSTRNTNILCQAPTDFFFLKKKGVTRHCGAMVIATPFDTPAHSHASMQVSARVFPLYKSHYVEVFENVPLEMASTRARIVVVSEANKVL